MSSLPKPKFCDQDWLQMSPTEKGRLCAACQKNIVDFSKMRWAEIVQLQSENGNSLCGMYSNKQLEYWGREVPAPKVSRVIRSAVIILLILFNIKLYAQKDLPADTLTRKILIKGIVSGETPDGSIRPLNQAMVRFTRSGFLIDSTTTKENGSYKIEVSSCLKTTDTFSIGFSYPSLKSFGTSIKSGIYNLIQCNAELHNPTSPSASNIITTYFIETSPPTLFQKLKWRFKSIFDKDYRDIDYSRFKKKREK